MSDKVKVKFLKPASCEPYCYGYSAGDEGMIDTTHFEAMREAGYIAPLQTASDEVTDEGEKIKRKRKRKNDIL